MTDLTCGKCGIVFGVPDKWLKEHQDKAGEFWCPNGHPRVFIESAADRLRREKDALELRLQAELNAANHAKLVAERERDKAIKEKRKVERRIAHGVCPCCNKTFDNVSHHMVTEHPSYRLPAGKQPKQIMGAVQ